MKRIEQIKNMNDLELSKFLLNFFVDFSCENIVCGVNECNKVIPSPGEDSATCHTCINNWLQEEVQ